MSSRGRTARKICAQHTTGHFLFPPLFLYKMPVVRDTSPTCVCVCLVCAPSSTFNKYHTQNRQAPFIAGQCLFRRKKKKKKNFHSVNRREKTEQQHNTRPDKLHLLYDGQRSTKRWRAHLFGNVPSNPYGASCACLFIPRKSRGCCWPHLIKPTPGSIIIQIDCNHHTDSKRSILPARTLFLCVCV